jgi:hypothetical protein
LTNCKHALGVTNDAADAFFWRQVIGDAHLGYKMAWCERDAAIYAAMILAFIVLGLLQERAPRLELARIPLPLCSADGG